MAPKPRKRKGKPLAPAGPLPALEPALEQSTVINEEGLDKVHHALATDSNEGRTMAVLPASWRAREMCATAIPIYLHALLTGLIPPFSPCFNVVISHYQIHLLHLDPRSVILLAVFAFLYEAMVGITPSVALFRHFFLLRLVDARQCSGCATFEAVAATAGSGIDFELSPAAKGFRKQWLLMDARAFSPLLLTPGAPASPSSGWCHEKLSDRRLAFVWKRLARLQELEVTAPMVVKEFVKQRIAPLQRHSRPMWDLAGVEDPMRLQRPSLAAGTLSMVLKLLTGEPEPTDLPGVAAFSICARTRRPSLRRCLCSMSGGCLPRALMGPARTPSSWLPS